jgi:hypothetical protein
MRVRVLLLLVVSAVVWYWVAAGPAIAAAAGGCPNEQLRAEDGFSLALPDCRAYEQVSPVEKNLVDATGLIDTIVGSPDGEALTYNSNAPFPVSVGASVWPSYRSVRGGGAWSTEGLLPRVGPTDRGRVKGVTGDLSYTLIEAENLQPSKEEGAAEGPEGCPYRTLCYYLRNNTTGSYQLLLNGTGGIGLVGAGGGDSRVFFESTARFQPEAMYGNQPAGSLHGSEFWGTNNLYELHEGRLSLVDVLPDDEGGGLPAAGASAGPGRLGRDAYLAEYGYRYLQGTVSEDGLRVFFTDQATGRVYLREPAASRTIAVSGGAAVWRAATPDGRYAFYTEGGGLYRFSVEGGHGDREPLTNSEAGVAGVLGVGDDGQYVYFVATGVLARGGSTGSDNLYVWHEGTISYITGIQGEANWNYIDGNAQVGERPGAAPSSTGGEKSSRVSADGRTAMFVSAASLTGYDNQTDCRPSLLAEFAGATPAPCYEVYLYSFGSPDGRLVCVSCNPQAGRATSAAWLFNTVGTRENPSIAFGDFASGLYPLNLPRNLSSDGSRVFFETEEALVPQAMNGVMAVYEWEREGAGSCPIGRASGCLYLISSGQGDDPSYFAEASSDGNDVLFLTREALVRQDTEELYDVYDARVGGGIEAQNPPAAHVPCVGEACRVPQGSSGGGLGAPASLVFLGPGNPAPSPVPVASTIATRKAVVKCPRGKKPNHGKCVKLKRKVTKSDKHSKKGRR